ncbi:unnamed protein product [Boreogadus saida]
MESHCGKRKEKTKTMLYFYLNLPLLSVTCWRPDISVQKEFPADGGNRLGSVSVQSPPSSEDRRRGSFIPSWWWGGGGGGRGETRKRKRITQLCSRQDFTIWRSAYFKNQKKEN